MSSQSQHNPPPNDQARPGQVVIDNVAPNQGFQGTSPNVTINHHHGPATPPTLSTLTTRQRAELLDRLKLRYRELLDHALPHQVRLQLSLHTRPDAVDPAWRRMLLRGPRASSQPVPPGTSPLELFDGQQSQLLVLGAPGAGKTTLIVELAQALTTRAAAEGQARIPVVLNVAAWRNGQSLRDWLAPTLRDLLGASKRFAGQLAASDDLLLLLDGLDEVAVDHRAACVVAINAYLAERDLAPPLVVGCRSREYADMGARLRIARAVELEPLELAAIEQALVGVPAAQGVLVALRADELLHELATTPLMVNVLLLAHGGQEVPLVQVQSLEERRAVLWWAYTRRVLQQRDTHWPNNSVLNWLRWLADSLCNQNQTHFLIDDLQPLVLPRDNLRRYYRGLSGLVAGCVSGVTGGLVVMLVEVLDGETSFGLLVGVVIVVLFGLGFGLGSEDRSRAAHHSGQQGGPAIFWQHFGYNLSTGLGFGLGSGLLFGLLFDMEFGLGFGLGFGLLIESAGEGRDITIHRREQQQWSERTFWNNVKRNLRLGLVLGLFSSVFFGLFLGSLLGPLIGLRFGLLLGFGSLILFGLVGSLVDGLHPSDLPMRLMPMQGIRASTSTGIIYMMGAGLSIGLGIWLIKVLEIEPVLMQALDLFNTFGSKLGSSLMIGVIVGVIVKLGARLNGGLRSGLSGGLGVGLEALIKHYTLRFVLWRAGLFPFRAVTFLDAMTERLLLERDGAFYRFRHLLLRDFIADLSDDDIARLAREIDGDGASR